MYYDEKIDGLQIKKWVKNEIEYDVIYPIVNKVLKNYLKINTKDVDLMNDIYQTIHIQIFEYKDKFDIKQKTLPILTQIIKGKSAQYLKYRNERLKQSVELNSQDQIDEEYDTQEDDILNKLSEIKNGFDDVKKNIYTLYF